MCNGCLQSQPSGGRERYAWTRFEIPINLMDEGKICHAISHVGGISLLGAYSSCDIYLYVMRPLLSWPCSYSPGLIGSVMFPP